MQRKAAAARRSNAVVQQRGPECSRDEEEGHAEAAAANDADGTAVAAAPASAQLDPSAAQGGLAKDAAGSPGKRAARLAECSCLARETNRG